MPRRLIDWMVQVVIWAVVLAVVHALVKRALCYLLLIQLGVFEPCYPADDECRLEAVIAAMRKITREDVDAELRDVGAPSRMGGRRP